MSELKKLVEKIIEDGDITYSSRTIRLAKAVLVMQEALCFYSSKLHIGKSHTAHADRAVYAGGSRQKSIEVTVEYEDGSIAVNALAEAEKIASGK